MNDKYILKREDIIEIDIETTGICNLNCPLCLSRLPQFKNFFEKKDLDINKAIKVLDTLPNIDLVTIAGDASEPTLYPYLFELLDYLDKRKNIYVEIFTNGSTYVGNKNFWNHLSLKMPDNSNLVFTICGTTLKLHEKYRVNSRLIDILNNHTLYKKCRSINKPNFPNDCMQYIIFDYNKNDNLEKIVEMENSFTRHYRCNTNPIYERIHPNDKCTNGICLEKKLQIRYLLNILNNKKFNNNILCHMYNIKLLRMDNFGDLYPCSFYKFFAKNPKKFIDDFGNFDYSDIFLNKCQFCYECTKHMSDFFNKYNCKLSFMC